MIKAIALTLCLVAVALAQSAPTVSPLDPSYAACTDLNGDFIVDVADLAVLLTQWGVSNCWNPAPTTRTYYMLPNAQCAGTSAVQTAVAVLRADRTQWSNTLSGTVAFLNGGPSQVTSISIRRVSDGSLFQPIYGQGSAFLTANPWGFSVYLSDAQFDELIANPANFRLSFGTTGGASDICAVFAEGVQPGPTQAPSPAPGSPTAAPTAPFIPDEVAFTSLLNNLGTSICLPFSSDGLTRGGTASFKINAVRTQGVLEGYSLTGEISLTGSAALWWLQIVSIKLVRVPFSAGFGPYVLASGPQPSAVIPVQALALFTSQGTDLVNNPQLYRLDIVTGTSSASSSFDQSEICGVFNRVTTAPTAAPPPPGSPTAVPTTAVVAAPTPFPFFAPAYVSVALSNTQCTPSGPFQNGLTGGNLRTGSADLLLTRTKAANVLTGSITFNVNVGETVVTWWNQVNRIEIRARATNALLVVLFGGATGINSNPFDSLSVTLSDAQLNQLATNGGAYYLLASSLGNLAGLVCGNLQVSRTLPGAPTAAPAFPEFPIFFGGTLDAACAGTTSLATGILNLVVFPGQPLSSVQGTIVFPSPASFTAEIGFIGIYRVSDDLLVQPLFSSGFGTLNTPFIVFNVQTERSLVSALTSNPQDYRVQVNTRTSTGGMGEICGVFAPIVPPVACPTVAPPPTNAPAPPTAAPPPTPVPPPFQSSDAAWNVPSIGSTCTHATTPGINFASTADLSLTHAPNAASPLQITLSGSFNIQNDAYRSLVRSVSIYRLVNGQLTLSLNLWSGSAGTLSSPRTFTAVVTRSFANQFQEFNSQFFIGTSIDGVNVIPVSICGAFTLITAAPTTAAPTPPTTAPPPTTATPTAAPTTAVPTRAPTPPTPVPAVAQTNLAASVTCNGGVNTFQMALLQLQSNGYMGTIGGSAVLLNHAGIAEVRVQRRSGVAEQYTALRAPLTSSANTFNSGFLSTAFSEGLRQNPGNYDVVIINLSGTTCSAPLAYAP